LSRPSVWRISRPGWIDRREQAGAPQIRSDHLADAARELAIGGAAAKKIWDGDRDRLDVAFIDLQPKHGKSRAYYTGSGDPRSPGQKPTARQQARASGKDVCLLNSHATASNHKAHPI
jgi:hypothetical protein